MITEKLVQKLDGLRDMFYLFIEQVRGTVADFAVFLSVTTWTFVDYMIGVETPKLNVPSDFKPTRNDRFVLLVTCMTVAVYEFRPENFDSKSCNN